MPTRRKSDAPNLLFLFPDQWRWDWLGCETSPFGKVPVRTPHIDRLAARGTRFTQCRTNSPLCAPARAALSLGRRYHRCGVPGNGTDLDPNRATVFNHLRDAGYRTLTCGKNDLHKKTTWKGRDGWTPLLGQYGFTDAIDQSGKFDAAKNGALENGGPNCSYTSHLHAHGLFQLYIDDYNRRRSEATHCTAAWPSPLPRRHYTDDFCGQMALQLLDRQPAQGPWMLWVNWPGPHDPFDPPRELQQRYDGIDFPPPVEGSSTYNTHVGVDHQQVRRNYAAACEGIDEWVGRILDRVAQRGELDNTLVVFSSDHGEMLGDHGRFRKSVAHEASVRVPLVVAGPGVQAGAVSNALVELIDLAATFLDFAGLDTPADWDARSLCPVLTAQADDASHRDIQISQLHQWRMITDGQFKLVKTAGEPDQLFDLSENPQETRNIASRRPKVVRSLSGRLRRRLSPEDPRR